MSLSDMAKRIFADLYSFGDESIDDTFKRVSKEFGDKESVKIAYDLMKKNIWRPNTPVFFNAGGKNKIFSACWVVDLHDSMDSIYDIANVARKIFQAGSGVGIPIGKLREASADIYEGQDKSDSNIIPSGKSSGPISFMSLYDAVGATTKSGGRARRAAIMVDMPINHPDIMEFIECKSIDGVLSNMNISVAIDDAFMQAFKDNIPYPLVSPANGVVKEVNARFLWDRLVDMAHATADPGVLFIDTINRFNPLKKIVKIDCTNPSLRAGTKVITKDGIYPIEQLENKSFFVINQKGEYSPAKCFLSGKGKELYEITLMGGKKYYSTAEHKWPVLNDTTYEKRLTTELKSGDYLPIVKMNTLGYGIRGDYDDGFVIGWNLGDGWITDRKDSGKRQYGFIFSDEDIANGIYNRVMKKITQITNKIYNPSKIDGCIEFNTTNNDLDNFFMSYGVDKKATGLPSSVWTTTSEDFRKGLIDGLFSSNGYVDKSGSRCVFCSSNYNLASDVSELLGFYGIKTRLVESTSSNVSFPNGKSYGRSYTRYAVQLFTSSLMHFRTIFTLSNIRKNTLLWMKESLNKGNMIYDNIKIVNITKTDIKEDVWDISVYDDTHTFKLSHVITGNCGEQPLIPFTSCNLSSINVHKFCRDDGDFDIQALYETAYNVTKLMDNLIDNMVFPDERFKTNVLKYRPIGVGIMGLADALYELGLAYDSKEGQSFAGEIMKTVTTACIEASADLAKERGRFHNYELVEDDVLEIISQFIDNQEVIEKVKKYGLRNSQHTTIAPTGSIALSCDCSYGMEPAFGLVFQKTLVESGDTYILVNPIFKKKFEGESWYTPELIEKIVQNGGSLKGVRGVPKEVRDVFVVAHDIKPKDRIDMQAALQKHVSTAISSTTNLPKTATRDEVSELYRYAYQKGLKGITIYRDGSKKSQPISFSNKEKTTPSLFTRPSKLQANVHVIETGNGKMYVTVSTQNGRPVEIFLSIGKSGQVLNTFCEALGRTVSIALQNGVPLEAVTKTLEGINSDRPNWHRFEDTDKKPTQILSIPDAIAKLLVRYYMADKENINEVEGGLCPKCGKYTVIKIEGCATCTSCGESRCG
jgi:ribonucleoside-diphosphate reductase alpha chain